jgi:hypothetical protein
VTEISRPTAEALVQARLGRSPQDLYEAAVVLEAWGGVPGPSALSMGRELMTVSRLRWPSPEHRHQRAEIPPGLLPEALALLVTVSVLALWAPALAAELGRSAVEVALWVALPLALASSGQFAVAISARPRALRPSPRTGGSSPPSSCP